MELRRTEQGFALYKEKDCIGTCAVRPAAQGADIAALCIAPQWRRRGYGSYLLKEVLRRFAGYDREKATVFSAPLPADPGERAFWAKFGFAAEGGRLYRRRTPDLTAVKFVQDFLSARLVHPRLCIDATCGKAATRRFCAASRPRMAECWALIFSPRPLRPPGIRWDKRASPPGGTSCTAKATRTFCSMCSPARRTP